MTAIMNSSFSSNHMNQIAIEEIEAAYPGNLLCTLHKTYFIPN